ncbi:MAG TPA: FAD-dependent oxidoreductase [Solirubrobacteraceae bacterium]|nr:FAD-dependent oxidoreductase [Solirubrobacteraceae bacterium]
MTAAGDLPHLLSPIRVGPVALRNRVVSTSHQTSLVHDHLPTADLLAYHRARARGGAAAVFLEATAVHASGLLTAHTVGGFLPEIVGAYRRLGDPLREHGARLFVQLFHGGREQISSSPKAPAVAPSAIPSLRFKSEPRALTAAEIAELIDGYRTAAAYAVQGGVDGVEVSISHGYLPAQFLSPLSNRRRDGYAGPLEGRLRFSVEILEAVRAAAGDRMAVGARLSADERVAGGLGVAECAEIVRRLHSAGLVDFVSLVLGHSAHPAASTWIAPPPPAPANAIADPAAAIRAANPGATLLATTRVVDLAAAEALVAAGTADLVGMTRALIADPDLVAKTVHGRADEVIECVGCNQSCIGHYHAGVPIGCAVNPRTGRERTFPRAPVSGGRRVLVIGGGPAGTAAALEAARAGDTVTLVEREAALGGQLRLAGLAPAHAEVWRRYERSTTARLRAAGVTVEFGVTATAPLAADHDLVVLATGARPYAPDLGTAPATAVQAWDVIRDPGSIGEAALVADWGGGWDGLDAAERLAAAGVGVTLACAATVPGETLHQYQRNLYLQRLDDLGVAILHHHELVIGDGGPALRHVFSGRPVALPAQTALVLAQGRVPCDELWAELESHPGAVRAGDVLGPRTLEEAVLEGATAVVEVRISA